jgi:hypothetical protein
LDGTFTPSRVIAGGLKIFFPSELTTCSSDPVGAGAEAITAGAGAEMKVDEVLAEAIVTGLKPLEMKVEAVGGTAGFTAPFPFLEAAGANLRAADHPGRATA